MNLNEHIISNALADTDPAVIATSYIRGVLDLASHDEQVAALEPSVRPHASRLASSIRRARRSGPAQNPRDSHTTGGGPAQSPGDSHNPYGGPAQSLGDSQGEHGGPALPGWAQENARLIAWCRDHQSDNFYIPGAGRRKLIEITADEWDARARWMHQAAAGFTKSAAEVEQFAALIRAAGATTLAGVLEAVIA